MEEGNNKLKGPEETGEKRQKCDESPEEKDRTGITDEKVG